VGAAAAMRQVWGAEHKGVWNVEHVRSSACNQAPGGRAAGAWDGVALRSNSSSVAGLERVRSCVCMQAPGGRAVGVRDGGALRSNSSSVAGMERVRSSACNQAPGGRAVGAWDGGALRSNSSSSVAGVGPRCVRALRGQPCRAPHSHKHRCVHVTPGGQGPRAPPRSLAALCPVELLPLPLCGRGNN